MVLTGMVLEEGHIQSCKAYLIVVVEQAEARDMDFHLDILYSPVRPLRELRLAQSQEVGVSHQELPLGSSEG